MSDAFIIGNGESRNIFPIDTLKGKGTIWGCNAIYRDHPYLCDNVVAVNTPMYDEIVAQVAVTNRKIKRDNDKNGPIQFKLIGPDEISKWNYLMPNDTESDIPKGLKIYRIWRGGDLKKKNNQIRTIDFAENRGSGTSAVLLAAESGATNIHILAFDILGAKQWEYLECETSREQNNIYKNTQNYPTRMSMKAYLKYEWLYHLRQIFRKHPNVNFYFYNRREYIDYNTFLRHYFDQENISVGTYGDLRRWIDGERDQINWIKY